MSPWRDTGDGRDTFKIAAQALEFLEAHGISADPPCYLLAYLYVGGGHAEASAEIERMLGAGALSHQAMVGLHDRLFGLDAEVRAIHEVSGRIETTLARVLELMGDAGKDMDSYGKVLQKFSGAVEGNAADSSGALREAIEEILVETRSMERRSRELERRFQDSGAEITTLRRSLDEMQHAASTDSLTGVANRKQFDARLRELVADCEAKGEPLALIMADVDFFKSFNDNYGHQIGDTVLRLVARTISDCVRGRDVVARYGGEEFAVILPETGVKGALAVAENIRKTMAGKHVVRRSTGENLGMVTLSFGVAEHRPGAPTEDLIASADAGLYRAKHAGRNRVEWIDPAAREAAPKSAPKAARR